MNDDIMVLTTPSICEPSDIGKTITTGLGEQYKIVEVLNYSTIVVQKVQVEAGFMAWLKKILKINRKSKNNAGESVGIITD
jgi:hypothetical protein